VRVVLTRRSIAAGAIAAAAAISLTGCVPPAPSAPAASESSVTVLMSAEDMYLDALAEGLEEMGSPNARYADDAAFQAGMLEAGHIWCEALRQNPDVRTSGLLRDAAADAADMDRAEFFLVIESAETILCP